jgi:hypothetical protein
MKLVVNLKKAREEADLIKSGGPYIGKRGGKWADPQHKIPWHEKKHAGKPAPKAELHDEHGATELQLHLDNTYEHHGQLEGIKTNLANHVARGTYDHAQAAKAFMHAANAGSKRYNKEHGSGVGHAFDPHTRMATAREMADDFHDEVKYGEHDHRLTPKHQRMHPDGIAGVAEKHGKSSGGKWSGKLRQDIPTFGKKGDPISITVRPDGHYEAKNTSPSAASKKERGHNPVMSLHNKDFDPNRGDTQFKMN